MPSQTIPNHQQLVEKIMVFTNHHHETSKKPFKKEIYPINTHVIFGVYGVDY